MKELMHFTADWCQPCKQMKPLIDNLITNNLDVTYIKMDVTDDSTEAEIHGVRGVPTFIAFVDGLEVSRHTGVATEEKLLGLFS